MDLLDRLHVSGSPAITITCSLFLAAYLLYRWLLPKPIPGIPYNEPATKSIFGDISSMLEHLKTHQTVTDWMLAHNVRHNSPIVQIFPLFRKPMVLVSDYREAQDILLRRTKEFDKPDGISDMMYSIVPDHHTVQPTNDRFRAQRKLIVDLMTPAFLSDVAAPQIHANFMDLIKLWQEKMRLSQGRPFPVINDIYDTAMEAIWAAVFGIENTTTVTRTQIKLLSPLSEIPLPSSIGEEAVFEKAPAPPMFDAIFELTDSLQNIGKSAFPRLYGWITRNFSPHKRRLIAVKETIIQGLISEAEARMDETKTKDTISAGIDHMLRREKQAAEKAGRVPDYHSKYMSAELFGLLIAGHDTTSTTLLWALKLLTTHPTIQTHLRTTLYTTLSAAHTQSRAPTAQEISSTPNPYLDACIEEILRRSMTATITSRTATTDARVLGHVVPRGSRVLLMGNGHGIHMPAFEIERGRRSKSYRDAGEAKSVGEWAVEGMREFRPERWLKFMSTSSDNDSGGGSDAAAEGKGEKKEVFDPMAGPHLLFGGGPRGCFGKKMAYIELRLAIVLIVWHFVLESVPEEYASEEPMEVLTYKPVQCYVRLGKAC